MAVIINELEVVVEGASTAPAGETAAPPQPTAAAAPSPDDVESILRFQAERAARLYAG